MHVPKVERRVHEAFHAKRLGVDVEDERKPDRSSECGDEFELLERNQGQIATSVRGDHNL